MADAKQPSAKPKKGTFAADLERYGPMAKPDPKAKPITPRQARRYCRRLAKRHYENFTVASRLAPRALRQHLCNVYAYCRWADDLADETGDPKMSLALLKWWETSLRGCGQGQPTHPVFLALRETIEKFHIPPDPFLDLLAAFRQDQQVKRYETVDQLLTYCKYSANPVGRLVLYLGEVHTPERVRLSDSVCTGLQLANFCQDVAGDYDRGRIYLPQTECRRYGYDESMFAKRECNPAFQRVMAVCCDLAEGWLRGGWPLIALLPLDLRLSVAAFVRGGLAIVRAIRQQNYDVWTKRPTVTKLDKMRILGRSWWQLQRGTLAGSEP